MTSSPIVDRIRIIPRANDFLNRNVGASGELFFSRDSNTLRVYNGSLRGGYEIVTEENIRKNAAAQEVASIKYIVKVNRNVGDTANRYVLSDNYYPQLTFVKGYTYIFDQSDLSNLYYPNSIGGAFNIHPLLFSSDNANGHLANGTTFETNVLYILDGDIVAKQTYIDKFVKASTRQVQITITNTTPSTLYYYCNNHLNMGNTITVTDPGTATGNGGSVQVDVSDTPPSEPSIGSIWFNSTSGKLYVYISDDDGTEIWVQPASPLPQLPTINSFSNIALADSTQFSASGTDTLSFIDGPGIQISADPLSKTITIAATGNSGVDLTAFSVGPDASPDSSGGILYNNTTGVFNFIPPDLSNYLTSVAFADITNKPTTLSGYGIVDAVEGADLGSFFFSGSTIDTTDSSGIIVTPAMTLQSDLTVQNDIVANNKILANEFISTNASAPVIDSASTLTLRAADAVIISGAPFRLPRFTDSERTLLSPINGDVIYNTTSNKIEAYQNGSWIELDTGASA